MRGEERFHRLLHSHVTGSPPHARGRVIFSFNDIGGVGITPACAGKSCAPVSPRGMVKDHPRMRGEEDAC